MSFTPGKVSADDTEAEGDDGEGEFVDWPQPSDDCVDSRGIANRHTDLRLQTRLTSKGLQKRLLNLYYDARTLEEEQGVNVLYLGLGALKWVDPKNENNIRFAPLVLVPVSLERASAGDRFKLRWRQEDPSSNLSLEAMLDRIHLLKLPVFEANDDFDFNSYCDRVAAATASKAGWEVRPDDIVLGFFSFAKFLMYRDLSPETWPKPASLAQQSLIQSLLRDGFPPPNDVIADDALIDPLLPPRDQLHILDSDSSQSLAVHDARRGQNLVIQGPPGTGKSQTIANIIAAAVADGKKVLFVAEKMAALEVVKRRLDATSIGDACLELHSNKANKKAVLEELKRTWELGCPRGSDREPLCARLTDYRDRLNDHADRIHREFENTGLTAYDVIANLTRLRDEGWPPNDLILPEASRWRPQEFLDRRAIIKELGERLELMGPLSAHPWRGVGLSVLLPNQLQRLLKRIESLQHDLEQFLIGGRQLASKLHEKEPVSGWGFDQLIHLADRLWLAPAFDSSSLAHESWTTQLTLIEELASIGQKWKSNWDDQSHLYHPAVLTASLASTVATLGALPSSFATEAFSRCTLVIEILPQLVVEVGHLARLLGLEDPVDTLAAASKAIITGQRVASAPEASPDVFAAAVWDSGLDKAAELAEASAVLKEARSEVGNLVLADAWEQDTESERKILRIKGQSFLRIFSAEWRRANSKLRSLVHEPKISAEQLLVVLDKVAEGYAAIRILRSGSDLGRAAFGSDWQGEQSQPAPLRAIVAWMRSLRGLGSAPRMIAARLPDKVEIGARAGRAFALINRLRPVLEQFWTDIADSPIQLSFNSVATMPSARLSALLDVAKGIATSDSLCTDLFIDRPAAALECSSMLARVQETQELMQQILAQSIIGRSVFGSFWDDLNTDWETIIAIAGWVKQNEDIRSLAAGISDRPAIRALAQSVASRHDALVNATEQLISDLQSSVPDLFDSGALSDVSFGELHQRLSSWNEHGEDLSTWASYRERAQLASSLGLADVVDRLGEGRVAPAEAGPAFEIAYYEAILTEMVERVPELASFDGELHGRVVSEFASLDRKSLHANRLHAVQSHYQRLPPRAGGIGPTGVLRGEIAKRRGHLAIRQLMNLAAPAVQALKPVFMMSPLSIAQFLTPGKLTFDLLVMDEASQIQPVDALGAIARCKQVVVVGDERQLPPTRFFAKVAEGEEEDEDATAVSDVESILGLFSARGLQQRMLRWHYRSRHESLIAVSNREFYENKLYIVPSPHTAQAGMGLRFHYIAHGIFDTGGTGVNQVEADAVAQAVVEHARAHPDQSLGVAAFSVRQRRAIFERIEDLRRENPYIETFFHSHATEPFFVKNLENVQGDERDVIFISVGYGRNAKGAMSMRFGPLGSEGGERRLNVLISRAKLRCEVFSSITDNDIDLDRARGKGVAAFKLFLRFARTGELHGPEGDSSSIATGLEAQVATALRQRGYIVDVRVGIAGLFVDLAVSHSDVPDRYLVGIELDGKSYKDARSARDRDRLRRDVLESHGWTMHRIWSLDWFHRPANEMERLVTTIDNAKNVANSRRPILSSSTSTSSSKLGPIARQQSELIENGNVHEATPYEVASICRLIEYTDIPSAPTSELAELVEEVVKVEGPVHFDIVAQRIRDAWGNGRAGPRIVAAIEQATSQLIRTKVISRAEDWLSIRGALSIARDRSMESGLLRKPELISPEELRQAILDVVLHNLGARKEELPVAVARLLGFSSTSAAFRERIEAQMRSAVRRGVLRKEGEFYLPAIPERA